MPQRPDERTIDSVGLTLDATVAPFIRLNGQPAEAATCYWPTLVAPGGGADALGAARLERLGRDALSDPGRYAGPAFHALEELGRLTGERTWRTMQRATDESRAMSQAIRREAGTHPLGALVLLGLGVGMAMLGTRVRALR